jgi:hypothetical protein
VGNLDLQSPLVAALCPRTPFALLTPFDNIFAGGWLDIVDGKYRFHSAGQK